MKNFIHGICVMLPCENCANHATAYIESKHHELDDIVSSRSNLFKFFWEFHNTVNRRLGKSDVSLADAYAQFS